MNWQRTIDKLFSGRWLLTVVAAIAFIWCVYKKELEAAAISSILTMIFNSYFSRTDRNKEEEKKQ